MEELVGNMVMVHPNLATDPANRQGQIGIITSSDLKKDEVYVGFGTNALGLYSTDALLVLKPHNEIYKDLLLNVKNMPTPDFKTLMEITINQEKGFVNAYRDALELASTNDNVLARSTVSLQEKLGIATGEDLDAKHRTGLGR